MSVRVPFIDLALAEESDAVREAIARVIDSGWFVLGPEVEAFEQEFAAASGAPHAIGVGNGTDALALILRALGIGAGDEVITTPLSAAYTAIAIVMAGARPVFADIDPERLTLDPAAAERAITARTAALLPVHLYGQPADMTALTALANRKGLALVEDCCQAHLATCRRAAGRHVRRRRRVQFLSDEESRRARRRRRRHHARRARSRRESRGCETADRPIGITTSRWASTAGSMSCRRRFFARACRLLRERTERRRALARAVPIAALRRERRGPSRAGSGTRVSSVSDQVGAPGGAAGSSSRCRHRNARALPDTYFSTTGLRVARLPRIARTPHVRQTRCCRCPCYPGLSPEAVHGGRRRRSKGIIFVRALITGGAGFIGSHLAEALLNEGHEVDIIDNLSTGSIRNVGHLKSNPRFKYTIDTLTNEPLLAELIDRNDVIFHFAAAVGVKLIVEEPVHTIETNVHGTEVVLKHANKKRKKVVIASTSEVYGKSADVPFREDADLVMGATVKHRWAYACSKAIDEFLALAYYKERGLPVIIVRFFNTVGPRQTGQYGMVLPSFVRQALAGEPITVFGDGTQSRSFTYVGDVVGVPDEARQRAESHRPGVQHRQQGRSHHPEACRDRQIAHRVVVADRVRPVRQGL